MTQPVLHPETQELRSKLAKLHVELRQLVEQGVHISTVLRPKILALYSQHFNELEIEKQRLAVQGAELFRRVELLMIKFTRGEQITPEVVELVNAVVTKEYQRMRQRLREAFEMSTIERSNAAMAATSETDSEQLIATYRILVKKLHPDSTLGDIDSMWHKVQDAYKKRNADMLKNLLTLVSGPEEYMADVPAEELQAEVESLQTRIRTEKRKIDRVMLSEPFIYSKELEDEVWREDFKRKLLAEITVLQRRLEESASQYKELTGTIPSIAILAEMERKDSNTDFDSDFRDNTYFSGR